MEVTSQSIVSLYLENNKSYVGPTAREYPFSYELLYSICRSRVPMRAKLDAQETQQFRCVRGLSTDACSCVQRGVFVLTHESIEVGVEITEENEQSETYSPQSDQQPFDTSSEKSSADSSETASQASRRSRRSSKKE